MPQARRLRQVVLVHMPLGHRPPGAEAAASSARARGPRGGRRRRHDQRVDPAPAGGAVRAAGRPRARGRARRRRRRPRAGDRGRRRAALRRGGDAATRATTCCSTGSRRRRTCPGAARAWAAWTATRRSPTACAAARGARVGRPGALPGAAAPARSSTARTPPRTCSCSHRTPRRTAWSSPRRWPAACRSSPPRSAGCPRRSGTGEDGTRPGLLVPPGDPAALGAALRAWLEDAELRGRLRRAARERRATLRPWAATAGPTSRERASRLAEWRVTEAVVSPGAAR